MTKILPQTTIAYVWFGTWKLWKSTFNLIFNVSKYIIYEVKENKDEKQWFMNIHSLAYQKNCYELQEYKTRKWYV